MQSAIRFLTHLASRLLECDSERESILGDLEERGLNGSWRGLGDLLALATIRQAQLWRAWRPWLLLLILFFPMHAAVYAGNSILQMLTLQPLASYDMRVAILSSAILTTTLTWCGGFSAVRIAGLSAWSVLGVVVCVSEATVLLSHPRVSAWFLIASALTAGVPALLGALRAQSPHPFTASRRLLLLSLQLAGYYGLITAAGVPPPPISEELILVPLLLWPMALPLFFPNPIRATK